MTSAPSSSAMQDGPVAVRLPSFVTFTGLDARAWLHRSKLLDISMRYPVEWGVLFSPSRQGDDPRYPALDVVERFRSLGLRLAAHLRGDHARTIVAGGDPGVDLAGFERVQVNHGTPDPGAISLYARSKGVEAIAQSRDPESFPDDRRISWLYDASGGRGVAPDRWPSAPGDGALVGHAGGLAPETVADTIVSVASAGPYWIDMESRIRTDDRLDLAKVEAVLATVYPTL
jgi:hypothetical protein